MLTGVGCFEKEFDSVYADPGEGITLAMRELLNTGHKNICLLNCSSRVDSRDLRGEAFRRALAEAGLPFLEKWDILSSSNNGASAYKAFRAFWEAGSRPDAIAAANGQSALGAMRYLYEIGVRVPDEISIIAYEDSSVCGYATPALTSVNIRKEEMGRQAAQCLLQRIRDPEREIRNITIPPYMVYRDSVKSQS
ncbi:MAG: substrate-binding domain-containing protein [Clostridia bacterium]|nr:substrate-binding domain-containing protein [Clostridia bacterium]